MSAGLVICALILALIILSAVAGHLGIRARDAEDKAEKFKADARVWKYSAEYWCDKAEKAEASRVAPVVQIRRTR